MTFLERCRPLYQNRDFRVILVLNILLGLAYSFVVPFMSLFGTQECHMNSLVFGVFMTLTALSGVLFGSLLAHWSDTRFSRRKILLLGGTAGMLGYIGYAYFRTFWPLTLVGTLVLGISSITFSQVFALAREQLGKTQIPRAETAFYMNAFRMFFGLAWTVGPAIASWIMVAYSFSGLFLSAAATFLLFTLGVARYIPEPQEHEIRHRAVNTPSVWPVLKRFDVLAHFTAFVLIFAGSTIGMMNLPLMVLKDLGGTERQVGIVYTVSPIFELPFMLYFGLLAMRMDSAKIIRIGVFIAVIYYLLLTLTHSPGQVYPMQIMWAASIAVTSGVAITYFQNYLPKHAGTATNLYANASRIGSTLGYILFGALAWRIDYRYVFFFCAALMVITLGLMFVPAKVEES